MPKNYSSTFKRKINATSADEAPLLLLEISHSALAQPARVVNDTQDLVSNGELFVALGFEAVLPDDKQGQMPRARLRIDNAGKDLVQPIEDSSGGEGATVRFMCVLRSAPDLIEWEATLDMRNVEMRYLEVTADVGYEDILNQPAVGLVHRPDVSPGLF